MKSLDSKPQMIPKGYVYAEGLLACWFSSVVGDATQLQFRTLDEPIPVRVEWDSGNCSAVLRSYESCCWPGEAGSGMQGGFVATYTIYRRHD
jgi:hypothetical protein